MDDLCERIAHPMGYYEARLEDAEEEDLEDWREREAAQDS
jgi:DNA primase large subunit